MEEKVLNMTKDKKTSMYCILTAGKVFEEPWGVEGFTISLAKWLQKQNLDGVIICSTRKGVTAEYLSMLEIKLENKNIRKRPKEAYYPIIIHLLSRISFPFRLFLKILSVNRITPIKLIHAQDTGYAGLSAIIAGRIMKIPVILSSHGIRHRQLGESIFKGRFWKISLKFEYKLDIFTIRNADLTIAVNPEIKDYFEKVTGKEIEFIPNQIKTKKFAFSLDNRNQIRKELGIDDKTIVVGYVGRLGEEKNVGTLIESFSTAILDNPQLKLVIVGTGREESMLKEEVRKKNIEDKTIFCGLRDDIPKVLSALDIFVLPSYTEGLSSALLEAMSCGCAIICSDIPGNKALIMHNNEGLLFDPLKPLELTEAILLLASDDLLRSKLGKNARNKAIDFDEDVVFPKILQHYVKLTNRNDV